LIDLTTQGKYRVTAQRLADEMRREKGVVQAADLVEKEIQSWLNDQT